MRKVFEKEINEELCKDHCYENTRDLTYFH